MDTPNSLNLLILLYYIYKYILDSEPSVTCVDFTKMSAFIYFTFFKLLLKTVGQNYFYKLL